MKILTTIIIIHVVFITLTKAQTEIGVSAPLSKATDCTTDCADLDFQIVIAQASGSLEGTVTAADQAFGGVKTFEDGLSFLYSATSSKIAYYTASGGTESFIRTGGGFDESLFMGRNAGLTAGGNGNVGFGTNALTALTSASTASHNTAVGWYAMQEATTAKWNTFVGSRAGENLTSENNADANTGVGWDVMEDATNAKNNAAFGSESGNHLTTGDFNTFLGSRSGLGVAATTTGSNNTFVGYESGVAFTTGANNTFVGYLAGSAVTTGSSNIFFGDNVLGAAGSASLINIGNTWYGSRTSQTLGIGVSSPTATLHLKAGTATANTAPLKMEDGTLLTTAEAGVMEYDNDVFYSSPVAGNRGVIPSVSFTANYAASNLDDNTSAQSVFDDAKDAFTVVSGTAYFFEAKYIISSLSTSSSRTVSTLFALAGGASLHNIEYTSISWSGAASTLVTGQTTIHITTNTAIPINSASTSTETTILLQGIIRVNAAGTITPQIQFSNNPGGSAVSAINSYFKLYNVGRYDVTTVGAWN